MGTISTPEAARGAPGQAGAEAWRTMTSSRRPAPKRNARAQTADGARRHLDHRGPTVGADAHSAWTGPPRSPTAAVAAAAVAASEAR